MRSILNWFRTKKSATQLFPDELLQLMGAGGNMPEDMVLEFEKTVQDPKHSQTLDRVKTLIKNWNDAANAKDVNEMREQALNIATEVDVFLDTVKSYAKKPDQEKEEDGASKPHGDFASALMAQDHRLKLIKLAVDQAKNAVYAMKVFKTADSTPHLKHIRDTITATVASNVKDTLTDGTTLLNAYIIPNKDTLSAALEGVPYRNMNDIIRSKLFPILAEIVVAEHMNNLAPLLQPLMDPSGELGEAITSGKPTKVLNNVLKKEKMAVEKIAEQLKISATTPEVPTFFYSYGSSVVFTEEGRKVFVEIWRARPTSSGTALLGLFQSRVSQLLADKGGDVAAGTIPETAVPMLSDSLSAIGSKSEYQAMAGGTQLPLREFLIGLALREEGIQAKAFSVVSRSEGGQSLRRDPGVHSAILNLGAVGILPMVRPVTTSAKWEYVIGPYINLGRKLMESAQKSWFALLIEAIMASDSPMVKWLQTVIKTYDPSWTFTGGTENDALKAAMQSISIAEGYLDKAEQAPAAPGKKKRKPRTKKKAPEQEPEMPASEELIQKERYDNPMGSSSTSLGTVRNLLRLVRTAEEPTGKLLSFDAIIRAIFNAFKSRKTKNIKIDASQFYITGDADTYVIYSIALHGVSFAKTDTYTFSLPTDGNMELVLRQPERLISNAVNIGIEGSPIYVLEKKTTYDGHELISFVTVMIPFISVFKQVKQEGREEDTRFMSSAYVDYAESASEAGYYSPTSEYVTKAERAAEDQEHKQSYYTALAKLESLLNSNIGVYMGEGKHMQISHLVEQCIEKDSLEDLTALPEYELIYKPVKYLIAALKKNKRKITTVEVVKIYDVISQISQFVAKYATQSADGFTVFRADAKQSGEFDKAYKQNVQPLIGYAYDTLHGYAVDPEEAIRDKSNVNEFSYLYGAPKAGKIQPASSPREKMGSEIGNYANFFRFQYNIGPEEQAQIKEALRGILVTEIADPIVSLEQMYRRTDPEAGRKIHGPALMFRRVRQDITRAQDLIEAQDGLDITAIIAVFRAIESSFGAVGLNVSFSGTRIQNPGTRAIQRFLAWQKSAGAPLQAAVFVSQLASLKEEAEAERPTMADKDLKNAYKALQKSIIGTVGKPPKALMIKIDKALSLEALGGGYLPSGEEMDGMFSRAYFADPKIARKSLQYADSTLQLPNVSTGTLKVPYISCGAKNKQEVMQGFLSANTLAGAVALNPSLVERIRSNIGQALGLIVNIQSDEIYEGLADHKRKSAPRAGGSGAGVASIMRAQISIMLQDREKAVTGEQALTKEEKQQLEDPAVDAKTKNQIKEKQQQASGPAEARFKKIKEMSEVVLPLLSDVQNGTRAWKDIETIPEVKKLNLILDTQTAIDVMRGDISHEQSIEGHKDVEKDRKEEGAVATYGSYGEDTPKVMDDYIQMRKNMLAEMAKQYGEDTTKLIRDPGVYSNWLFMRARAEKMGVDINSNEGYAAVLESMESKPPITLIGRMTGTIRALLMDNPSLKLVDINNIIYCLYGSRFANITTDAFEDAKTEAFQELARNRGTKKD